MRFSEEVVLSEFDESDIPEASDEQLNRWVAEWAADTDVCPYCAGSGVESQHTQATCRECDGEGECWPDYCNDDAAAMRLLSVLHETTTHPLVFTQTSHDPPKDFVEAKKGVQSVAVTADGLKRALAEVGAKLACGAGVWHHEGDADE